MRHQWLQAVAEHATQTIVAQRLVQHRFSGLLGRADVRSQEINLVAVEKGVRVGFGTTASQLVVIIADLLRNPLVAHVVGDYDFGCIGPP
ncbi:hypothetical protein D9M73_62700 [compost metagenome]